jgi:DNA polymerase-3 subunit gamma/tau
LLSDLIEHLRNLLVIQCDPQGVQDELSAEAIAALAEQSGRISADKLLDLIEQFAAAEGRMKWAPNKKMHFEIAAIRAIQTLGQTTLTEVLDTLTALRGGGPLPEKAKGSVAAARAVAPTKSEPAAQAPRPSLLAAVAASLGESKSTPPPVAAPEPTPVIREEPAASAPVVSAAISVDELWPAIVARVRKDRPLISGWVEAGLLLEIKDGAAVVGFAPDQNLAMEYCEKANNRKLLEQIATELAGRPLALKCVARPGLVVTPAAPMPAQKPEPPADPMLAFKNDPLIQKALAEFKAEILPA